ncbi:MAG: lysylphosphatidylglycerol synthase transmembrane domain-containing protein [Planctomycetota bacterium]
MPKEVKSTKKHMVSVILRVAVAIGALFWVFRGEDIGRHGETFARLSWWVIPLSTLAYVLSQVLFAVRWLLLLRTQDIHIGLFPAVKLHFLGLFYNNCLPSSIGGDLLRAWYVTKHTDEGKKLEAALSVLVDRLVGLSGMIGMAFFCYWVIPTPEGAVKIEFGGKTNPYNGLYEYKWVLLGAAVFLGAVIATVLVKSRTNERFSTFVDQIWHRGWKVFGKLVMAVRLYCSRPLVVIAAYGLTVVVQSIAIIATWIVGWQLGIEAPLKYYFVFLPVSWLLGALPVSIGGIGVMEGGLKFLFSQLANVSGTQALDVALAQRIIIVLSSLPGLAIHVFGAHLPRGSFLLTPKSH